MEGIPAVAEASLPPAVRSGTAADKERSAAALGFENIMLGELVREMTKTTPGLAEGPRADAVNDALTDALTGAGGIGLAPQLFSSLQKAAP